MVEKAYARLTDSVMRNGLRIRDTEPNISEIREIQLAVMQAVTDENESPPEKSGNPTDAN
jgi:hypothetical protein